MTSALAPETFLIAPVALVLTPATLIVAPAACVVVLALSVDEPLELAAIEEDPTAFGAAIDSPRSPRRSASGIGPVGGRSAGSGRA